MAIDNFELIKPLLEFRSDDDFFFLQIIQRKKDHPGGKVNGTNNNNRSIKPYFVRSLEYLDFIEPEIKEIAEIFGARVGIDLNRRSYKSLGIKTAKKILSQIENGEHNKIYKAYTTVCGKYVNETEKKWILDIDEKPFNSMGQLLGMLRKIQPAGDKIIAEIPSMNGVHIITSPFNTKEFDEWMKFTSLPHIGIHKKNPTNLYIPNSLTNKQQTNFSL